MNSKLELRNMAVNSALNVEGVTAENVIEVAKKIYEYVIGNAELPERYNPNEAIEKMTQMWNNNKPKYEEKETIEEADFAEEPSGTAEAV